MDDDLAYLEARTLGHLFRERRLSPVAVAEAAFRRLDRWEPKLNAFVLVDREGALAAARAAEARFAAGTPLSALDGVPVTIKDLIDVAGWPTRFGSLVTEANPPAAADAPATARLREAGAVILGKTTTPDHGWKALGDSPFSGVTRNPWDLSRTPGGSSAGAAAALAAGIAPLAIGTDGGGSIRIPCAFTGTVGIKATFGRVPAYPPSAMGTLANVGPMTRSVTDLALLLHVIGASDERDPWRLPPAASVAAALSGGVAGLRIAVAAAPPGAGVESEIAAAVARAGAVLAELGATIVDAAPDLSGARDIFMTLWHGGAGRLHGRRAPADLDRLDPGLAAAAREGARTLAAAYLDAEAARTALGTRMGLFFRDVDLLLLPSVAVSALPIGADTLPGQAHWIDWTPFSYPFNLTRQPAISVPCGLTAAGLPIGLQIVGRLHEDATVLRAAFAFEATQSVHRPTLPA